MILKGRNTIWDTSSSLPKLKTRDEYKILNYFHTVYLIYKILNYDIFKGSVVRFAEGLFIKKRSKNVVNTNLWV